MNFSIGFNSNKGLKRSKNEDSFAVLNQTQLNGKLNGLLVVADGMGGMRGGEVASKIVVETIPRVVIETLAQRNGSGTPIDAGILLRDAIIQANGIIWQRRHFHSPEVTGMGTTCVAAIVQEGILTIANVGDSRAYLLREGKLTMLTEDHSEVFEQVQAGAMTLEQASRSQFRNIVTRGVGLGKEVMPDITTHAILEGDTILLCSDGLTTEVSDPHIAALLSRDEDAQAACDHLVKAALRHGGRDNITVVAMRYGDFVPAPQALPDWDEDEPDTDPTQEWRHSRPLRDDEEEDEDEEPPPPPRRPVLMRRRPPLFSGVAQVVILLLALICLAEGAALYYAVKNRASAASDNKQPSAPPPLPTDLPLNYGPVTTLSTMRTFQDDFLEVDPKGNALVVTLNGNLMKISPLGQELSPVRRPGNLPSLPDKQQRPSKPDSSHPPKLPARPDIALDASGNLYMISSDEKRIVIFNADGVRINSGLPTPGKGELSAPTRIAVDNTTGSIYILDNHLLKRIAATPAGQNGSASVPSDTAPAQGKNGS